MGSVATDRRRSCTSHVVMMWHAWQQRRGEQRRLVEWETMRRALRSARMPTVDQRYRTPDWRSLRALILERDGAVCQIRDKGCTHQATQVDHITPVADGGAFWDERNLRAACQRCNGTRGARVANRNMDRYRYRTAMPTIVSRF